MFFSFLTRDLLTPKIYKPFMRKKTRKIATGITNCAF